MTRCRDCNATLTKTETVCIACGSPVPTVTARSVYSQRFATFVKIAFFVSLGLTVAALLLPSSPYTPSFAKCAVATVILHFVRNSADQMMEKKRI
jgi:hypothetical protein